WDVARFEVCGHKWADLSEGNYGVALLNDCKYGYGITEGKMTLSLIKSGILPNPTTDQEEHFFTYSILPHSSGFETADIQKEAYCLNVPMYGVRVKAAECKLATTSLLSIDADNVMIETVKLAESGNGTIIRMYENQNKRTNATIHWHKQFASVVECDLMENAIGTPITNVAEFGFTIKPFEIKTFKVVE
ncbi:MAG: glycosyl hydrolase-related protein, partial [Oscillospiraceae bacterium]